MKIIVPILFILAFNLYSLERQSEITGGSFDINISAGLQLNAIDTYWTIGSIQSIGYRHDNTNYALGISVTSSALYSIREQRFLYFNFGPQYQKYFPLTGNTYFSTGPTLGLSYFEKLGQTENQDFTDLGYFIGYQNDLGIWLNLDSELYQKFALSFNTALTYNNIFNSDNGKFYPASNFYFGLKFSGVYDFMKQVEIIEN